MRRIAPFAAVMLVALAAAAQPSARPSRRRPPAAPAPVPVPTASAPTNLRARVGTDHAKGLLRSLDPDEHLRGIERAAALGTPDAIALLTDTLDKSPQLRTDTRALLALARGLGPYAEQERARAALFKLVETPTPSINAPAAVRTPSGEVVDEGDPALRVELAREIAAIALAKWGGERAAEELYAKARTGGVGQPAAIRALELHPPREPGFFGTPGSPITPPVLRMLADLGDLRALEVIHAATRATDTPTRGAAIVALAELGDSRAALLARAAIVEPDAELRRACGEAFVLLGAPERFSATKALIEDEDTTAIGVHLAERVHGPEITKLLAARAASHPDRAIRIAAIHALGASPEPDAAKALVNSSLLADPEFAHHALDALARSPAPSAGAILDGLLSSPVATLAARAYVVRALVRGEHTSAGKAALEKLAKSRTAAARSLGTFAKVALGEDDAEALVKDDDRVVRRAAAMGALARRWNKSLERALLRRLAVETDPVTRQVLALGLQGGDPDGLVKTSVLVDRAESAGGDAPLAAFALARRADAGTERRVEQLLASKASIIRAHVARGLGLSALPDASGRLANAYRYETDADVRRAIIEGLAARTGDATAPARADTLKAAAELDPDGATRQAARRALPPARAPIPFAEPAMREVAWLRLVRVEGDAPGEAFAGAVVRSDGVAVPIFFDEDGFALVPGLPPGEARLLLAPRLPADKASSR